MKPDNMNSNPVRTMLTISIGFMITYYFTGWQPFLVFALIIGLIGMFSGYLSAKIDFIWMQFARLLGLVIPNLVLGLVFYLVLFPLALLSRVFRRTDFLSLKNPNSSLFTESKKQFIKTSFEKPW